MLDEVLVVVYIPPITLKEKQNRKHNAKTPTPQINTYHHLASNSRGN
jgi:hypothetical protein